MIRRFTQIVCPKEKPYPYPICAMVSPLSYVILLYTYIENVDSFSPSHTGILLCGAF